MMKHEKTPLLLKVWIWLTSFRAIFLILVLIAGLYFHKNYFSLYSKSNVYFVNISIAIQLILPFIIAYCILRRKKIGFYLNQLFVGFLIILIINNTISDYSLWMLTKSIIFVGILTYFSYYLTTIKGYFDKTEKK